MSTPIHRPLMSGVIIVALFGSLVILAVSIASSVPVGDVLSIAAIGAGTAVVVSLVGSQVLRALRRRSLAVLVAATAIVVLVPVAIGAWVAAEAMFLSEHDLTALSLILVAAGTVGIGTALLVGHQIGAASNALVDVARRLGKGETAFRDVVAPVPSELGRLYDELLLAADQLEDSRRREQALEHSRRELVAWVSHDLRTPLAAIRAVTEALEDGIVDDPADVARYHTTIRREADRLSGLVDDLFELSRTQSGVLRLEFARVSVGDLVSDAIAGASAAAQSKGVTLQGNISAPLPLVVASAPEVLRALRNVLENAIRHTPSDGTIRVEVGAEDEHAYISVLDSGGGIPERDLDRVFHVGYSGDPARTAESGAGLGLAIARGLVEAHQGDLTVRNERDGACFTFLLPLASTTEPAS